MKWLGVGTALAAALVSAPGVIAQPYCAYYADGTRECGIPALQTCTQSVVGVGGYCGPDETQSIPPNLMQRWRAIRIGRAFSRRSRGLASLADRTGCRRRRRNPDSA